MQVQKSVSMNFIKSSEIFKKEDIVKVCLALERDNGKLKENWNTLWTRGWLSNKMFHHGNQMCHHSNQDVAGKLEGNQTRSPYTYLYIVSLKSVILLSKL